MSRFAYAAAPNINVAFVANATPDCYDEEAEPVYSEADLVVCLGNVDLDRIAAMLPADKPALAVLGSRDPQRRPPEPFRILHGNGVAFKDWRVAGLSGGLRTAAGTGFTLTEQEAGALLGAMPSCDLLISYAPAAGLDSAGQIDTGFQALTEYIVSKEPVYHFYASATSEEPTGPLGETWTMGINSLTYPESLKFV